MYCIWTSSFSSPGSELSTEGGDVCAPAYPVRGPPEGCSSCPAVGALSVDEPAAPKPGVGAHVDIDVEYCLTPAAADCIDAAS